MTTKKRPKQKNMAGNGEKTKERQGKLAGKDPQVPLDLQTVHFFATPRGDNDGEKNKRKESPREKTVCFAADLDCSVLVLFYRSTPTWTSTTSWRATTT